ncbi:MAG TPA: uroporphyrinogen decarboxylase family protein [Anaerolineales bacterium]|nr:uroporphyrinogen decarboxylase family protein [Anaerolineales bacterium]
MTTHRERIQATLRGEIIDRPPVALWRHFPVDDQSPQTLAEAHLHYQKNYDFDLLKVTPASSFCLIDWGVEDQWAGDTEGTRRYTKRVVSDPGDWESLPVLDPSSPRLSQQLECLQIIRGNLDPDTPLLQTIFSPLSQAKNLAGGDVLLEHLHQHPKAVMKGLKTIARTTGRFIDAARAAGIDGIFYAVQHAQKQLLSYEEYKIFGLRYDQECTEPAQDLWCNILHLHGQDVHFELAMDLPFQVVNWHDRESSPSLAEAQRIFQGVVCGGMRQDTLVYRDAAEVRNEAADALEQTGGKRLLLGTGCVVPVIASHGNLMAARRSVE